MNSRSLRLLLLIATGICPILSTGAYARGDLPLYKISTEPIEARVDDLLGRLTPDEKIVMLGGTGFTTQPIVRLGVPGFVMTDGPVGARNSGPTTAYTAGVALAAAWNPALAERVGTALGRDCRARGVHILLAPGINLYRAPMCGRNFEYFGEDPLLSGKTAAAYVRGVQSQGVAATVKHFAVNNQEFSRHDLTSDLDETTLLELYTRNFQIAVREGQPKCVMTSYNPINGVHASQNIALNQGILRNNFGFKGLLMSDWDSCYDTVGMALSGLDLEMPKAVQYKADKVRTALEDGKFTAETIDASVRRQLRVAFEMGWFDRPQTDPSIPRDDPANAAVALDEAREGIVLLKNTDGLLPLDKTKVRQIVVVGPNGGHPVTGGGGSSYTKPFHAVSVTDGLKEVVGDPAKVVYLDWKLGTMPNEDTVRIMHAADAVVVSVGFDWPGVRNAGPDDGQFGGGKTRDFPPQAEGEGGDRAYTLPPGSAELITAAAAANPRTVVVLNAGGSVETANWIDKAAALIHAFYPGQAGNTALAEIIFGQTNPSGKLPWSWEKRWEDSAAYGHYPTAADPKVNDYKEGLLLGYRWFDTKGIEPLYPFGFGLSYTSFTLSEFKAANAKKNGDILFTVNVRNTGKVPGAEVVQVYADGPGESARPARELKAYDKVFLQPGETKTVTMFLNLADLATWDATAHAWKPAAGERTFQAGDCSRNLTLRAALSL